MNKLINAYREAPTRANAHKLVLYLNKHPMAQTFATREDHELIRNAMVTLEDAP